MFELKECLTLAGKTTLILLAYGTILRVLHRSLRRQRKECGSQSRRTARQLRSLPKEEQIPNNNIKKFVYIIIVAIRYIFTANNIFNKIVSISFGLNSHLKLIV